MSTPSLRTEQVYVTRSVRNGLETLAQFHIASQPEGVEGPSITAITDGMADQILREYLDGQPMLQQKRKAIREALKAVDARFLEVTSAA